MKSLREMSAEELRQQREELIKLYENYKAMNLSLDMTRGKPSPEQLDLSNHMYDSLSSTDFKSCKNEDVRNYGVPCGIEDIRKVFADILADCLGAILPEGFPEVFAELTCADLPGIMPEFLPEERN